jgi:hypothetical protein
MLRTRAVVVVLCLACRSLCPAHATAQDRAGAGAPSPDTLREAPATRPAPPSTEYRFPSGREQLKDWALNAFGPSAIAGNATSAAWGQWVSDEPPEWPDSRRGFAQRFGAASLTTAITETSFSLLSAASRQDARYYRCPRRGLGPRLGHALGMTFMARRPDGSATFSVAKTASPFVGPLVTRATIYPERYTGWDGALSGAYALLMNAGWNLAREFVLKAPRW